MKKLTYLLFIMTFVSACQKCDDDTPLPHYHQIGEWEGSLYNTLAREDSSIIRTDTFPYAIIFHEDFTGLLLLDQEFVPITEWRIGALLDQATIEYAYLRTLDDGHTNNLLRDHFIEVDEPDYQHWYEEGIITISDEFGDERISTFTHIHLNRIN